MPLCPAHLERLKLELKNRALDKYQERQLEKVAQIQLADNQKPVAQIFDPMTACLDMIHQNATRRLKVKQLAPDECPICMIPKSEFWLGSAAQDCRKVIQAIRHPPKANKKLRPVAVQEPTLPAPKQEEPQDA